jgi:hypothetical protein
VAGEAIPAGLECAGTSDNEKGAKTPRPQDPKETDDSTTTGGLAGDRSVK